MEEIIEKIKSRLATVNPDGPRKVVGVFQLNIDTDDGVKNYVCDLKNLTFADGVADEPDVTLETDEETLLKTTRKEISLADAALGGKIRITGNPALVLALTEALNIHN